MTVPTLLGVNAIVLVGCFLLVWLLCVKIGDMTPVDSFWAFGMVLMAFSTFAQTGVTDRRILLTGLCALWGIRLGLYLLWRWRDHGPDRRYRNLLGKAYTNRGWGLAKASLILVFATQAPLLFIVCLPVQLGQLDATPIGLQSLFGTLVALVGIACESLGDWQLTRFRKNPDNQDQVMRSGLWRYTRHPNYFGDACCWWGLYLIAADSAVGWWSLPGPVLLTWTLMKWSGAPLIEGRMKRKKPGYDDYIRRTSGFVPWPPKPTS
jgi:steroid 5-alpha reductase family enzyme